MKFKVKLNGVVLETTNKDLIKMYRDNPECYEQISVEQDEVQTKESTGWGTKKQQ